MEGMDIALTIFYTLSEGYHTDRTQEKHYKVITLPSFTNSKVTSRAAPLAAKNTSY